MKTYGIAQLPDDSRVWVFQSSRKFSDAELDAVKHKFNDFLEKWAAHGKELYAAFEIRFKRFIVIALNEHNSAASGCSIDSMMRVVQAIDKTYSLNLLDRTRVTYRDGDEIKECDSYTYRKLWALGEVSENTIVFNNIAQTIGELKSTWEVPAKDSWHINLAP